MRYPDLFNRHNTGEGCGHLMCFYQDQAHSPCPWRLRGDSDVCANYSRTLGHSLGGRSATMSTVSWDALFQLGLCHLDTLSHFSIISWMGIMDEFCIKVNDQINLRADNKMTVDLNIHCTVCMHGVYRCSQQEHMSRLALQGATQGHSLKLFKEQNCLNLSKLVFQLEGSWRVELAMMHGYELHDVPTEENST